MGSRSRSRSPHRSSQRLRRTNSPKRSRHRTHTHSRDHREDRATGDSERRHRSRSRSPLLEEKYKLKKKGSVDKKKPVPTTHKKDHTRFKADLKVAKREKIDESEENNSSDFEHSDETTEIMRVMGFSKFHSTKGEKNPNEYLGKTESEVRIVKKRRYRQYMNRRGGFNRPLDPIN